MRSLPTGDEKSRTVRAMFDRIAPRYDLVNRVISLGLDRGWRRRTIRALSLPPGSFILDVACGTGDLCNSAARAGHRPIGADYSEQMLANARVDGAPLLRADALSLPVRDGAFDGYTCGFALRNVADLSVMFDEISRVLRPGGRFALLEVGEPRNRLMRAGHRVWFRGVVPMIGGLLSDREAYRYLPRSVAYLPEPGEITRMLRDRGFLRVRVQMLSGGLSMLITGTRA